MTIVYASDKNYAGLTAISAVSALKHNSGARIVLLGYNLEAEAQELVRLRVEKAGGEFLYRDVSPSIQRLVEQGYCGYTSYAAYARVFIADVLDEKGKVLYLDCDTLVNGSLKELFEIDLKGNPFALGVDCITEAYKRYVNLPNEFTYLNSGVMLIDLECWREKKCTTRILSELSNPRGPNPLGDQDIIVRCFPNETTVFPPKWNFLSHFFMVSYNGLRRIVGRSVNLPFSRSEYDDARKSAVVYHFSGHTMGRPWYTSSRHPMRRSYQEAARDADLAEVAEQVRPMMPSYAVQYFLYRLLPQSIFDVVCFWLYRLHIRLRYRA